MKKNIKHLTIVAVGILLMVSCTQENKVMLFNGNDLSNWDKVLFDSSGVPDEVFRVEDGVINVSGASNGYIITKESYGDYKLHVEWRWSAEPKNSGVLLHVQETNTEAWPNCIEAQLYHSSAGDFIFIRPGSGATVRDSTYLTTAQVKGSKKALKFEESSENPAGEWNTYEITCEGGNIELIVNGVLQNAASEATFTSGRIALQSEGGPIEFRNVYLVPLPV